MFPLNWTDKTNYLHSVPLTSAAKKTAGGKTHDNWSLLRFLLLLIGNKVLSDQPVWQNLCELQDIVELVSLFHTEESNSYLDYKISEHRSVFQDIFHHKRMQSKHH